jgi:hypothetical protein
MPILGWTVNRRCFSTYVRMRSLGVRGAPHASRDCRKERGNPTPEKGLWESAPGHPGGPAQDSRSDRAAWGRTGDARWPPRWPRQSPPRAEHVARAPERREPPAPSGHGAARHYRPPARKRGPPAPTRQPARTGVGSAGRRWADIHRVRRGLWHRLQGDAPDARRRVTGGPGSGAHGGAIHGQLAYTASFPNGLHHRLHRSPWPRATSHSVPSSRPKGASS